MEGYMELTLRPIEAMVRDVQYVEVLKMLITVMKAIDV
jgi:hypothetical protein